MTLKYRPGSKNSNADMLSRLPLPAGGATGEDCDVFIDDIEQSARTAQTQQLPDFTARWVTVTESGLLSASAVAEHTASDPELSRVLQFVQNGWPKKSVPGLEKYWGERLKLHTEKNCVMWGDRRDNVNWAAGTIVNTHGTIIYSIVNGQGHLVGTRHQDQLRRRATSPVAEPPPAVAEPPPDAAGQAIAPPPSPAAGCGCPGRLPTGRRWGVGTPPPYQVPEPGPPSDSSEGSWGDAFEPPLGPYWPYRGQRSAEAKRRRAKEAQHTQRNGHAGSASPATLSRTSIQYAACFPSRKGEYPISVLAPRTKPNQLESSKHPCCECEVRLGWAASFYISSAWRCENSLSVL